MTFITGNKPHNKISNTSEDFIRENYKTMTKPAMGKELGIHEKSVLRIMNRLGLKRTTEELLALRTNASTKTMSIPKPIPVLEEPPTIESLMDKVPVKVNKETTVWVKKSKCKQLENGDCKKLEQIMKTFVSESNEILKPKNNL